MIDSRVNQTQFSLWIQTNSVVQVAEWVFRSCREILILTAFYSPHSKFYILHSIKSGQPGVSWGHQMILSMLNKYYNNCTSNVWICLIMAKYTTYICAVIHAAPQCIYWLTSNIYSLQGFILFITILCN